MAAAQASGQRGAGRRAAGGSGKVRRTIGRVAREVRGRVHGSVGSQHGEKIIHADDAVAGDVGADAVGLEAALQVERGSGKVSPGSADAADAADARWMCGGCGGCGGGQ